MGIIHLKDIKPGMILGEDLKDRNGRILLCAGIEITEKHLRILRMWGIIEADIRGVEQEERESRAAAQIDPFLLQEVEAQLNHLFFHTDRQHPFIHELFRLLTLRRALQLSKEKGHDI